MGTPGDKAKISKVVKSEEETQLDPEKQEIHISTTTTTSTTPSSSSGVSHIIQPSTSTTEMGLLSRLPQFETFATLNILPSLSTSSTTSTIITSKPETFQASLSSLEQAHIEDYFTQTKFYPSVTESIQQQQQPQQPIVYTELPSTQKATKTPYYIDEPAGPSGLQTKSKQIPALIKLKRAKKGLPSTITSGSEQERQQQEPSKREHHTCRICQKSFASKEKLTKHEQIHTGLSPFKCEHCKKSFSSKFKLVRHVLIHSDRKPFSCTVCERTFHRNDHLKNHIKIHSPSKKSYICEKEDCKKKYTSLLSYRKHLALHAAEEGSLQCQICSNVFETKDEILYHLKIHTGSRTVKNPNEKKFTCDQCDRKFFTKKDVRRHSVVHTGKRDFLCQFCPQRFGRKDHLVRHIKKSHSKNFPTEEIETAIKSEIPEIKLIKKPTTSTTVSTRRRTAPETIVKAEDAEQFSPGKLEMEIVKSEFTESSSSQLTTVIENPEGDGDEEPQFGELSFDVSEMFESENFAEFLESTQEFLPSTSSQGELKDLACTILEEIESESTALASTSTQSLIIPQSLTNPDDDDNDQRILSSSGVLSDPEIQRLLQSPEKKALPPFSETFQPPPPPP